MYPTEDADWRCYDGDSNIGLFCRTDNSTLTVFLDHPTMGNQDKNGVRATLDNSYNTTELNVQYVSTPVTSGSAETDIIYRKNSTGLGPQTLAKTFCEDKADDLRCDQHYINAKTSTTLDRKLACHETGHAVGLTHGGEAEPNVPENEPSLSCMIQPDEEGSDFLGDQNVAMINGAY